MKTEEKISRIKVIIRACEERQHAYITQKEKNIAKELAYEKIKSIIETED